MRTRTCLGLLVLFFTCSVALSQQSSFDDELRRIFEQREYAPKTFGPAAWWEEGRRYTTVEDNQIIAYNTASGTREILISTSALTPAGAPAALTIDDYSWSNDRGKLLLFTNSKKVWRDNTRGDYWILDLATKKLRQLGGQSPAATLMFAKFSPDGTRVGYVRENNIYIEEVASGALVQLTTDGSVTTINGTSDWVYEEEFGLRDCFQFSPDGRTIAYWQFDSTGIEMFTLINDTDSLYPTLTRFPYPKVGTTNSAVRVGVIAATGGATKWMSVPGDPRDIYLARMDWLSDS